MANITDVAIPKGSTILVTGATGFIGSHVVAQVIKAGYKVRGTVRDEKKSQWIRDYFHEHYPKDQFETTIVPDFGAPHAFKDAIKGVSGIAHVAGDVSFGHDPNKVIPPVIRAIEDLLADAAAEPSVKRIVLTSSSTAVCTPEPNSKFHVGPESWNEKMVEMAYAPPPYTPERGFPVYGASKVEGEKAVWKFVKEKKPHYVVNTVLPNYTIGAIFHENIKGSTSGSVKSMFLGDKEGSQLMAMIPPQYMVSGQDIGLLHVGALVLPDVQNQRLLGFADKYSFNSVLDELEKFDHPRKSLVAKIPDPGWDLSTADADLAVAVLKKLGKSGFDDTQTTLKDLIDSIPK